MRRINLLGLLLAGALLLITVSCGGSTTSLTPAEGTTDQAEFLAWVTEQRTTPNTDIVLGGLPGIPIEREISLTDPEDPPPGLPPLEEQQRVVLGKDYILKHMSTVAGDALIIGEGDVEEENTPAFGMYKVAELVSMRPLFVNVECLPTIGSNYFVGVANYTKGMWDWFGPASLPELEINLSESTDRYVTQLGNMYFLVACQQGKVVTHQQTTVTLIHEGENPVLPGRPMELVASDGQFPNAVGLFWIPGGGEHFFEVWRSPDGDPAGSDPGEADWQQIGISEVPEYFDEGVPPGVPFRYKVRAVNPAGASPFSNVDVGWAGEGPPPGNVIEGFVFGTGEEGGPLGGVTVLLAGPEGSLETRSNEGGHFWFEDLQPGYHCVIPYHPEFFFEPRFAAVHLGSGDHVTVEFHGFLAEGPHQIWGFVFQNESQYPTFAPVFDPLPGVGIHAFVPGAELGFETETGEHGFFVFHEIPVGGYLVEPLHPEFIFDPPIHDVHVNGELVTPPLIYFARPDDPPPPSECVIEGLVHPPGETGGINVFLLGLGEPVMHELGPDGGFRFGELPPSRYLVYCASPEFAFGPFYHIVEFNEPGQVVFVSFEAFVPGNPNLIYGFVEHDILIDIWPPGYNPLPGTLITLEKGGTIFELLTNEDGFYIEDGIHPNGEYNIWAEHPDYVFTEEGRFVHFNGETIPPPQNFFGFIGEGGGDPGI